MDEANEGAPVFAKVKLSLTKNKCFFENGSIAMHRWWTGAGQHVLGPAGDRAKGEGDRQEVLFWPGMLSYGMICDGMVWYGIVRFPDPPYGVGREKEPPRSWEKNFEAT